MKIYSTGGLLEFLHVLLLLGRSRLQRTRDNGLRCDLLALRMDSPLIKAGDHLRKGISDEVQGARVVFEEKKQ